MKHQLTTIAFAALATALPAAAQGVYRCGDTYSQQPCPGGRQVEVTSPTPSANEQARARQAAQADAKTADAMEKARLKEEAKPVSAYIPPAKSEPASEPKNKPAAKSKRKNPDYFTAVAPGEKKSEKKK